MDLFFSFGRFIAVVGFGFAFGMGVFLFFMLSGIFRAKSPGEKNAEESLKALKERNELGVRQVAALQVIAKTLDDIKHIMEQGPK